MSQTCRACGCTDSTPCLMAMGAWPDDPAVPRVTEVPVLYVSEAGLYLVPCWWSAPDLCAGCQDAVKTLATFRHHGQ